MWQAGNSEAIICRHEALAQISGGGWRQDGRCGQHRAGQSLARRCEPFYKSISLCSRCWIDRADRAGVFNHN